MWINLKIKKENDNTQSPSHRNVERSFSSGKQLLPLIILQQALNYLKRKTAEKKFGLLRRTPFVNGPYLDSSASNKTFSLPIFNSMGEGGRKAI